MKILLVSSYIFGYMKYVVQELEREGHTVDVVYFDDIPFSYRNLGHKITAGIKKVFGHHERKMVREQYIKNKIGDRTYDVSLLIHSHYMNDATNQFIRTRSSHNVAYFFDSIAKMPRQLKVKSYFDNIYSYEPSDCKKYGFQFLPNFIPSMDFKNNHPSYIVFNIAGIDERFPLLKKLVNYFEKKNISHNLIIFTKRQLEHFKTTTEKLDVQQVLPIVKDCKVMLDIQRPVQKGLTFRVFEALGNDKKLITTNSDIINYDFFNPNNILLLNPDKIEIPRSFLASDYQPIDPDIIDKYTVKNWCFTILNSTQP